MKTTIFCGLIAVCLLAGSAIPGSAQNKRWEHNLYEGVGMAKKFDSHDNQTVAFHVGYGINYYLSSNWSVMPGVAVRAKALGHNSGYTGSCASTYIDIPLLAQYHFGGEKRQGIVLELGPVVSFLAHSERYSGTEWCPQHPYWGMKEYKKHRRRRSSCPLLRDGTLAIWPAVAYRNARHQEQKRRINW